MTNRRQFLTALAALPTAAAPLSLLASAAVKPLQMPPLLDARNSGAFRLRAQSGQTDFLDVGSSPTWGLNGDYLGPTVRVSTGRSTRAEVFNGLDETTSLHWHGLLVPGEVDGGPHQKIAPGGTWTVDLPISQPACTAWYHSHVHGATARQVMSGLAGVLQIDDGQDTGRGLPTAYGIDDLTLVLQDRRFDRRGRIDYRLSMPDRMMGFLGDRMVVNGQLGATAIVPRSIVRLRLLNGSNARIYPLSFEDGRDMHLIATDSGYLDRPITLSGLVLSPGERAEILVDFTDGGEARLISQPNPNRMMMGGGGTPFVVLPFSVDDNLPIGPARLPDALGGETPAHEPGNAPLRQLSLDMPMGMGRMMMGGNGSFAINGRSFDMERLDFGIKRGSVERWRVSSSMMMHPFHIHGMRFAVLSENGRAPSPWNTGWKDTILVNGEVELLAAFDQPASPDAPFLYHCHILEHEDGGMMGQFSVT